MDKQQHHTRYRRSYDQNQNQYRGAERRSAERRNKDTQSKKNIAFLEPLLNELIVSIRQLINESADVRNSLEERKTAAIEQIANDLKQLVSIGFEKSPSNEGLPIYATARKSREATRDRVLEIIREMRDGGATYDQIALQLEAENLPTFSGRGKWHAQTVHRIHSNYLVE